jgi:phosphohistidine phosphatase
VAEESGYAGEIELHDEFYPGAPQDYLSALQKVWDEYQRVMVVGHNPGLEELLETLTSETLHLPTAALAQVALPIEHWIDLDEETEGTLINLWSPR